MSGTGGVCKGGMAGAGISALGSVCVDARTTYQFDVGAIELIHERSTI